MPPLHNKNKRKDDGKKQKKEEAKEQSVESDARI